MLAPSMARGIDLPGDLCRVQVIAKAPFLSLGDAQVARRTHLPGGDVWYAVQAIRDIVQMTGRAVRSKDDHAITYIFDQQFSSNLWRKNKMLFPDWWRESVKTDINIREFM
jgi:Rad3-related DNA helicase